MFRARTFFLLLVVAASLSAQKKIINVKDNPNRLFNEGVQVGDTLYLSGQMGRTADGKFPESFTDEVRLALQNQANVLKAAGYDFNDVVKVTCFLADMKDFDEWNKVYKEFFKGPDLPARSTVAVAALVGHGHVEVEMIAVKARKK